MPIVGDVAAVDQADRSIQHIGPGVHAEAERGRFRRTIHAAQRAADHAPVRSGRKGDTHPVFDASEGNQAALT